MARATAAAPIRTEDDWIHAASCRREGSGQGVFLHPQEHVARHHRRTMRSTRNIEIKDTLPTTAAGVGETRGGDDTAMLQQFQRFNREPVQPRAVFAEGAGAFGTCTVTHDLTRFTRAAPFAAIARQTTVLMRFSSMGSPDDSMPSLRGVSLRLFSDEGNWDLVGANAPVFFLRDPEAFTDMAHAQLPLRTTGLTDPRAQWDFWSRHPESLHLLTVLFSDRGRPLNHRFMHGYGVHTHSLINERGERIWCRFHLLSQQGTRSVGEAERVTPADARRDLMEAVARQEFPRWNLCVQLMTGEQARGRRTNPFDPTMVWPHAEFPLQRLAMIELNRAPSDFAAEIEQAAFKPGVGIPGIGGSPDPLLRARLLAYADAQTHRLGARHEEMAVNQPRCPVMRLLGSAISPSPTEAAHAPTDAGWRLAQDIVERFRAARDHDDRAQPRALYQLLDAGHRDRLARRIAASLSAASADVQLRQLQEFLQVDADYGARVANHLGIDLGIDLDIDIGVPTSGNSGARRRELATASADTTMTCGAD